MVNSYWNEYLPVPMVVGYVGIYKTCPKDWIVGGII